MSTIYAVTITSVTDALDAELDALHDLLPSDAAVSFNPRDSKLSVTFAVDANDPLDATRQGGSVLSKAIRKASVDAFTWTEVHAMDWDDFEASLAESNMPDIVSAPEVAEILGVSRQRVHQLIAENKSFPPPLLRLGAGPIWLRATIEAFDRTWSRKPGRPRNLTQADLAAIVADDPVTRIDKRATEARVRRENMRVAAGGRGKR